MLGPHSILGTVLVSRHGQVNKLDYTPTAYIMVNGNIKRKKERKGGVKNEGVRLTRYYNKN